MIKRDDLLPFPLAGNKVRKLFAEFEHIDQAKHHVVTVGAVDSNHCRTTAMICAQKRISLTLVLHGDIALEGSPAASMLGALGANIRIVQPNEIRTTVDELCRQIEDREPYVIAGGCHTPAGVVAYRDAVVELSQQLPTGKVPSSITVACGTGATHAGIVAGCEELGWDTRVIGVSVARNEERAKASVIEAINWVRIQSASVPAVEIDSSFVAGGYAQYDDRVIEAVQTGWNVGLPIDPVYTGKAFASYLHKSRNGELGDFPIFWHTGGLMQQLVHQAWKFA